MERQSVGLAAFPVDGADPSVVQADEVRVGRVPVLEGARQADANEVGDDGAGPACEGTQAIARCRAFRQPLDRAQCGFDPPDDAAVRRLLHPARRDRQRVQPALDGGARSGPVGADQRRPEPRSVDAALDQDRPWLLADLDTETRGVDEDRGRACRIRRVSRRFRGGPGARQRAQDGRLVIERVVIGRSGHLGDPIDATGRVERKPDDMGGRPISWGEQQTPAGAAGRIRAGHPEPALDERRTGGSATRHDDRAGHDRRQYRTAGQPAHDRCQACRWTPAEALSHQRLDRETVVERGIRRGPPDRGPRPPRAHIEAAGREGPLDADHAAGRRGSPTVAAGQHRLQLDDELATGPDGLRRGSQAIAGGSPGQDDRVVSGRAVTAPTDLDRGCGCGPLAERGPQVVVAIRSHDRGPAKDRRRQQEAPIDAPGEPQPLVTGGGSVALGDAGAVGRYGLRGHCGPHQGTLRSRRGRGGRCGGPVAPRGTIADGRAGWSRPRRGWG